MGAEMPIIGGLSLIAIGVVFPVSVLYALRLVWPITYERLPMQREERLRTGNSNTIYGVPIREESDRGYSRNPEGRI